MQEEKGITSRGWVCKKRRRLMSMGGCARREGDDEYGVGVQEEKEADGMGWVCKKRRRLMSMGWVCKKRRG